MKITLYEFKQLPEQEQYNITFNKGTFLDYLTKGNKKLVLYAVDLFFVELEYNTTTNQILKLTIFKTGKELFKYSNFKGNTI